ncbi:hypothetical protein N7463_005512 [Penicillium fimorum]|uniref:Uncharacterized protein n=1 Tax=Penicillium fimorum TaxID=1882269 RepID=A0A9X0C573_9EURO|nr:hypothetical protein N7463_005512 [Penicillium fimorum]
MLVETTHVKAQGTSESSTSLKDALGDSTVNLNDILWANHRLPPEVTSSFEVCNIKRTYKLNLRLAFLVGHSKLQTVIRDLEFPVYVMGSTSSSKEWS